MADATPLGGGAGFALDPEVYGAAWNGPLVHEVVVAEQAARRRGTHSTRNRALVRGGGAKPYRQKGTGRARQGSTRAPQFTGGGTVFGPAPHHHVLKVNRKARRAALRSALSVHAERKTVYALDAAAFGEPSTKQAARLLADAGRTGTKLLLALADGEQEAGKSFRNLPNVTVMDAVDVGVCDIVRAGAIVFTGAANDNLVARAKKPAQKTEA